MPRTNYSGVRVLCGRPRRNAANVSEQLEAHTAYGKELFQEDNRPRNAKGLLKEFLRRQDEAGEWERQCRVCGDFMPECEEFFERTQGRLRWNCRDCRTLRDAPALHKRDGLRIGQMNRRARRKQAQGRITKADIDSCWGRQKGRCHWCGCPLNREGGNGNPLGTFHADHYIPLSRGGSNQPENIVLSCPGCNLSKGARLPEVFRDLKQKQLSPTLSVELDQ